MRRVNRSLVFAGVVASQMAVFSEAAPPPLVCSSGDGSWRLELETNRARLSFRGAPGLPLLGRFSSLDRVKAHAWRGRAPFDASGEVVAIKACILERTRTEAVVFAATRPDKVVHLVLRLPGERYADCDLPPGRGPVSIKMRPQSATLAAEELAAVLTFLPREAPSEGCFRSQLVPDELGKPFAWISLRGC